MLGIRKINKTQVDTWCGPESLFHADKKIKFSDDFEKIVDQILSLEINDIHIGLVFEESILEEGKDPLLEEFFKRLKKNLSDLSPYSPRRISLLGSSVESNERLSSYLKRHF